MKRIGLAATVLALVTLACSSGETIVQPSEPVQTGTPVPRLQLSAITGRWTASAALTLHDDGTYELVTDIGTDQGEYNYRRQAGILRLTTTGGDMCAPGELTRFPVSTEVNPDGDGTRLVLGSLLEECRPRGDAPNDYDMAGSPPGDELVGEWRHEAIISIAEPDSYSISTPFGDDIGTFTYDDWRQTLTLVSGVAGLCEPGDPADVEVSFGRYGTKPAFAFAFRDSDCFGRGVLTGLYLSEEA